MQEMKRHEGWLKQLREGRMGGSHGSHCGRAEEEYLRLQRIADEEHAENLVLRDALEHRERLIERLRAAGEAMKAAFTEPLSPRQMNAVALFDAAGEE